MVKTSESQSLRYLERLNTWNQYQALLAADPSISQVKAAQQLGISNATLSRLIARVKEHGPDGLKDKYHLCGRTPALALTSDEEQALLSIYLKTNRSENAGSMQTACKLFALSSDGQTGDGQPGSGVRQTGSVREEIRAAILAADEKGRVPGFALRVMKKISREHFAAHRKPGLLATQHFSGRRGAFAQDRIERLRIVESDDATLNFPSWIPWPQGGDPCSDKFGVRLGRWQFLPALESGWSQFYLGYVLVARPRGSYTQDDVRAVIHMVLKRHGLPDSFRFERGTWESNSIVDLLQRLGIELQTVWQSNHKPHIEGGFNSLWNLLSVVNGQVGRFRGEMEKNTQLEQQCQAGRRDPRDHFPSHRDTVQALDGAIALRNADRHRSKDYGSWIPEVRHRELAEQRPWQPLPADVEYLFSPIVREWTVAKGIVGNTVALTDDLKVPFHFFHEDLWRMNGQRVRVYFDPTAPEVIATIVATTKHASYLPGEIICTATCGGQLPHYARAAMGWAAGEAPALPSMRGPLSQVRRETRALAQHGKIQSRTSEEFDGRGNRTAIVAQAAQPAPARAKCPSGSDQLLATPERATPARLAPPSRPSSDKGQSGSDRAIHVEIEDLTNDRRHNDRATDDEPETIDLVGARRAVCSTEPDEIEQL